MMLLLWHHNMQEYKQKLASSMPYAIFVHCYAHFIKDVKIFFATLSGFRTLFAKSTKRTEVLDTHVRKRFPYTAPT
jgi:hypothetical protein